MSEESTTQTLGEHSDQLENLSDILGSLRISVEVLRAEMRYIHAAIDDLSNRPPPAPNVWMIAVIMGPNILIALAVIALVVYEVLRG